MARQFNGTSDYLVSASALNLSTFGKLGISVWLWWDTFGNNDDLAMEYSVNHNNNAGTFIINPNESTTGGFNLEDTGTTGNAGQTFTRPSAGAWHHYAFNFDFAGTGAAEAVSAYVDGVSQSLTPLATSDNSSSDTFGSYALYLMSRGGTTLFGADVGVLRDVNPTAELIFRELDAASYQLSLHLTDLAVRRGDELQGAIEQGVRRHIAALVVIDGAAIAALREPILELARKKSLPVVSQFREFADAGGLMAYGPNLREMYRRAAIYIDKILKGAKPGDLPVEQPTKFELVVNVKTAKALGLTIPPSLLLRADQVIE